MCSRTVPPKSLNIVKGVLFCVLLILGACGGGGGGSSVGGNPGTVTPPASSGGGSDPNGGTDTSTTFSGGISGSGHIRSRIQGFGSVIINDDEYDTDGTTFIVEEDETATQVDLDIGKVISIDADFDNLVAETIVYRAVLKGPIDSIVITDPLNGEALITSLGQTILTNASTNIKNVDLSQLQIDDLIEVSGVRDENEHIIAGFIERQSGFEVYKLMGIASNVTSSSLGIAALVVDYSTASLEEFEGDIPVNGQLVEVKAQPSDYTAPDRMRASEVEFIPGISIADDDRLEIEGIITRFDGADDFDVSGLPVTTSESETNFVNGTGDTLVLGVFLEAEGGINSSGVLEAVEIVFKPTNAVRVEGNIEAIDLLDNSLTALSLTFLLRESTQLEDDGTVGLPDLMLSDLNIGDRVELRAFQDGAVLIASKIEREDIEDEASLRGPVTAIDSAMGTIDILGITITTDASTEYEAEEGELEEELSSAEFFSVVKVGDILEAEWQPFISIDMAVSALEIEDE